MHVVMDAVLTLHVANHPSTVVVDQLRVLPRDASRLVVKLEPTSLGRSDDPARAGREGMGDVGTPLAKVGRFVLDLPRSTHLGLRRYHHVLRTLLTIR